MVIDTHCHIAEDIYKEELGELVSTLKKDNVDKVFCVGYSFEMNKKCVKCAEKYDNVYAIVGIHPSEANEWNENIRESLINQSKFIKVLAIGEIGLDYHFEDAPSKEQQKYVFIEQIKLAHELGLPFVVHVRDAVGDLIQIFRENKDLITNGGLIHCYGESFESYEIFKSFGFKVAFGGAITFKNATKLRDVVKKIPLEDIVLETDCPYMTPVPFRGQINYPKYVNLVAQKIAEIKGVSLKEVEQVTTENAYKVFGRL